MFAHFVFGRKAEKITVVGAKDDFKTENWASVVMEFGIDQRAILYYDSITYIPEWAYVAFENGQVQIPELFHCPEKMIKITGPLVPENHDRKTFEYPLNDDRSYSYNNSSGLRYEQDHVYDLIQQGKLESDVISLQDTMEIQEMMQEIRNQLGVIFPHDE
jgi:dihydrodiol dehydrogenase / D-xylose 1-dehydrogenase (NADP)